MKKIRIDRTRWIRGGKDGNGALSKTSLCEDKGGPYHMCCLGFAAHQLSKKSLNNLIGKATPGNLKFVVSPLNLKFNNTPFTNISNTTFSSECIGINDTKDISDKMREYKLKRKFKSQGLELEFYN